MLNVEGCNLKVATRNRRATASAVMRSANPAAPPEFATFNFQLSTFN